MANALGYVSETKSGFEGTLAMMNLSAAIRIEKNAEKTEDGHPDYRIYAGETSTEIGGGWMRKSKASGRDYVSLTLADPQIGPRRRPLCDRGRDHPPPPLRAKGGGAPRQGGS